MSAIALYIHIPFCRRKCAYCAFQSLDDWKPSAAERITRAVLADLDALRGVMSLVATVYVGGGTPTVLPPHRLAALVRRVTELGARPTEVTVEANPESATDAMLAALASAGVTRLSVGVQTLEADAGREIGRRLTTIEELGRIRDAWTSSLAIDLIHGLPGSTPGGLAGAVEHLARIGIDHLSVYGLSVETGTPLAASVATGTTRIPELDDEWPDLVRAIESLGLRRYEVSNFARPGAECRHNQAYWRGEDYLGLGPSAVSTVPQELFELASRDELRGRDETLPDTTGSSRPRIDRHAVRVSQPTDHATFLRRRHPLDGEIERLGPTQLLTEHLMLGLRTTRGIDRAALRDAVGAASWARVERTIGAYRTKGLLTVEAGRVRATHRGMDLLDGLLADLLAAMPDDAFISEH